MTITANISAINEIIPALNFTSGISLSCRMAKVAQASTSGYMKSLLVTITNMFIIMATTNMAIAQLAASIFHKLSTFPPATNARAMFNMVATVTQLAYREVVTSTNKNSPHVVFGRIQHWALTYIKRIQTNKKHIKAELI